MRLRDRDCEAPHHTRPLSLLPAASRGKGQITTLSEIDTIHDRECLHSILYYAAESALVVIGPAPIRPPSEGFLSGQVDS